MPKIEKNLKNIIEKINVLEKINSDQQTIIDKLTSMTQFKYTDLMEKLEILNEKDSENNTA